MSGLRLRIDGDRVVVERPKGGGWASDAWETVGTWDRLQAANVCADLEDWLAGGVASAADMLAAARAVSLPPA